MASAMPALLVMLKSSGLNIISGVHGEAWHLRSAGRPRWDWCVLVDSASEHVPYLPSRVCESIVGDSDRV
jgi:hypothetical protein